MLEIIKDPSKFAAAVAAAAPKQEAKKEEKKEAAPTKKEEKKEEEEEEDGGFGGLFDWAYNFTGFCLNKDAVYAVSFQLKYGAYLS